MASTLETVLLAMLQNLTNNAMVKLSTQTLGSTAASVTLTPGGTYTSVMVLWQARTTSANASDFTDLQFNGDVSSNYGWQYTEGQNTTAAAASASVTTASLIQVGRAAGGTATAGYYGGGQFWVPNWGHGGSGHQVTVAGTGMVAAGNAAGNQIVGNYGGAYNPSAAMTSMLLKPAAGSWAAGSTFSLYGLN